MAEQEPMPPLSATEAWYKLCTEICGADDESDRKATEDEKGTKAGVEDDQWWKNGYVPEDIFIPYDNDFLRKTLKCLSIWKGGRVIAISYTRDVTVDDYLLVRKNGMLINIPSQATLAKPIVIVNSTDNGLAQAAMSLAYRLGCPACQIWPERNEITLVRIVKRDLHVTNERNSISEKGEPMITYTKLRNGEWGLRVVGELVKEGQKVEVKKKDGSIKQEIVGRMLFKIEDGAVYAIKSRKQTIERDWPGKLCPNCGSEPLDHNLTCWECGYRSWHA